MLPSAILFGAIGTLAETSELQRRAFNMAFAMHDLDWIWEPAIYYRMLRSPGGRDRVASYAEAAGDRVDAKRIHAAKEDFFRLLVRKEGITLRDGVRETIRHCHAHAIPMGFCTTTSERQVDLILQGLAPALSRDSFDWIGNRSRVERVKPAPDIYRAALRDLGVQAGGAIAIEDTPESARAALSAGLHVLAVPGRAAKGRAFPEGVQVLDRLSVQALGVGMNLAAE
ncbi:HAD family phosphatase [Jannaschia sp. M317]|uniref:HAD family hydrolase n=1 Tax=Jannaschia sp. M317 TaxID=2867011 RepID=UPI0021A57B5D|nr:HAD-IA family hydrolase [Jannaschia sp. M317]UWQ19184.1 HAD-IA family hydrolase [Jannaschia sp. M317]